MKIKVLLLCCFITARVLAQTPDSLTLTACYVEAVSQYPLTKQKGVLDKLTQAKISALQTTFLPQLSLNAQLSYQSDVTEIPIQIPMVAIPAMDKDQYKVNLEASQLIYDGGLNRQQLRLEKLRLETGQLELAAELYKIKERVNQLYFSILLFQNNKIVLESAREDLVERSKRLASGVKNGLVLPSQLEQLQAEILKVEQQVLELEVGRQSGLEMLGVFLNRELPLNQGLVLPAVGPDELMGESRRIEPQVMELQQAQLDLGKKLVTSRYLPKMSAFGQAGYGKPGLNMLQSEFDSYYLVGARLSWNLWNWRQASKEQRVLDYQGALISAQKESFDKNLAISLKSQAAQLAKYEGLLKMDQEIIALRQSISRASASQLEHGVITSSDYISDINQETQARLNLESHRIQLVKAKVDYLTTAGRR